MHLPHPNKMTVDLCDTKGLPLSEEEQSRIPHFQRAMRSTVGAILFALVAFMVAPIPLVYIGSSLPILLWARVINPRSARLVIDYCCSRWIYVMVCMFECLFGIRTRSFGYSGQFKKRCVFIMNHLSHFDWMFFWGVVEKQGDLHFWKVVTKDEIIKLPFIGQVMQFMCHIFVTRKWEKDQPELCEKIYYLNGLDYPVQLLLFPEGGDLTYKTKQRSDDYADENGLPRYTYCLHPRTTGFVYIMNALRSGGLDAVYDITIGYPDIIAKTEVEFGKGIIPREVHFHMRSYDAKDLPEDDDGLAKWCKDRWREKEERLTDFYAHREFRECVPEKRNHNEKMNGGVRYQKAKEFLGKKHFFSVVCSILVVLLCLNAGLLYLLLHSWSFRFLGVILLSCLIHWNRHGPSLDYLIMSFSQKETEHAKARSKVNVSTHVYAAFNHHVYTVLFVAACFLIVTTVFEIMPYKFIL